MLIFQVVFRRVLPGSFWRPQGEPAKNRQESE